MGKTIGQDDGCVLPEFPQWRRATKSGKRNREAWDNDNGSLTLVLARECDHMFGKSSGDGKRQVFAHREQIRELLASPQGNQRDKLLDAAVAALLHKALQKLLFLSAGILPCGCRKP